MLRCPQVSSGRQQTKSLWIWTTTSRIQFPPKKIFAFILGYSKPLPRETTTERVWFVPVWSTRSMSGRYVQYFQFEVILNPKYGIFMKGFYQFLPCSTRLPHQAPCWSLQDEILDDRTRDLSSSLKSVFFHHPSLLVSYFVLVLCCCCTLSHEDFFS